VHALPLEPFKWPKLVNKDSVLHHILPRYTLRNRVLQGFFTNTYNKPYPIGFFKKPLGVFHSVKNPIG
jgi:hypothetical protein